jgi:hypothetical protein
MEPNNFEKEFKDKLQNREIQPSEKSWDRLNAMLEVTQENKPRPNNSWLYIAASVIGFLMIGYVFFSQTEELVDVKRNNVVVNDTLKFSPKTDKPNTIIANPQIVKTNKKTFLVSNHKTVQSKNDTIYQLGEIVSNSENKDEKVMLNNSIDSLYSNKATILVDTNYEIVKPSLKVNASHLLKEVDGELELSFREKVINTIDKNYKKVKVVLAKRNQE